MIRKLGHLRFAISLAVIASTLAASRASQADDMTSIHLRCESTGADEARGVRLEGVLSSTIVPGPLLAFSPLPNPPQTDAPTPNKGSWQFDGRTAIVSAVASSAAGFAENFTWEGFFLSPAANMFHAETGIADRFLTQFAFDKGDWTRLAIGLVAHRDGRPRLCVELEGFEGRTFGMGDHVVASDRWHHFALVHEGTAAAARIRWYLDYELTGELFLGGQANQNTLRPPGQAAFTIGARRRQGDRVNRGFAGFMDEVRLIPRPLRVEEFLRCAGTIGERIVTTLPGETAERDLFWEHRHRWARQQSARWTPRRAAPSTVDALWPQKTEPIGDAAFLRRLSLQVRGRIPTGDEVTSFLQEDRPDKRPRIIDQMLTSPEWADGWVGYWQDVLAENPSVVFPTLNNSGAFRQWIYESFRDNKPFDRWVTELLLLENTDPKLDVDQGPAGFALATGNDAPMAMRAHVALKAFAAVDLTCARCHDSPIDEFKQADLFLVAAYLNGGPLEVPATSVAAAGQAKHADVITTSLVAGQVIAPRGLHSHWLNDVDDAASLMPIQSGARADLAALITSPRNGRFSDVIVNRVWKRYFGRGLLEPVDQWPAELGTGQLRTGSPPGQPDAARQELLAFLSAEFVASGYDLQALARRILTSETWQSRRERRARMSAEQLVDSLFLAVGKDFQAETLGVHATDAGAVQLPRPARAWQFAALPNERDRPALGMPVNQTIVDVMATFGWTGNRQQPRSERDRATSAHQPLMLFNGLMSQRIVRLSDQSAITELCLQEVPVSKLVEQLFLGVLGRRPNEIEQQQFVAYLRPGYEQRRTGEPIRPFVPLTTFQPDWRKHLEAKQTRLMLAAQRRVSRGERPTDRLTNEFRERAEDVLWALINSPEFVIVP